MAEVDGLESQKVVRTALWITLLPPCQQDRQGWTWWPPKRHVEHLLLLANVRVGPRLGSFGPAYGLHGALLGPLDSAVHDDKSCL